MSTQFRYKETDFKSRYWETCKGCGESIVIATFKTGATRKLESAPGGNGQPMYKEHECEGDDE